MEINGFLLIIFFSSKPQGHTSRTASVPANMYLNHGKATLLRSFRYWGPHFPFGTGFTPCELGRESGGGSLAWGRGGMEGGGGKGREEGRPWWEPHLITQPPGYSCSPFGLSWAPSGPEFCHL